ncbi:hypothetical protein VC83_00235 [Pseudogymnoascus destructans]|uniref:Glycosyltransferase family 92 protein n=2 Tax=Pseudogymnoascus destructans TaxID=655981 RepID=L8FPX2_PSED2|nr:uncharacterized protein VC83_00235 [Pseudogymnoascus destructans]ELR02962.1 hypothetical protein GMDG_05821 [Pseudogymnoascus destructans 20631-21]OAF63244.1 hypothetical protein VC83_00235 [Pseudogymnoascus destructans]
MLDRASGLLSKLRWRNVVLTIVVLTIIHFAFLDDTLQSVYNARAGKVADVQAHPELSTGTNAKPAGSAVSPPPTPTAAATTIIPTPTSVAPFEAGDTTEHIAICLSVKDQYADLTEWLTHHYHHLGIRRFYLMDDGSSPALATLNYSAFVDPKTITHRYYHPALHERYQQLATYNDCIRLFGHKHKWIAFIDADEFLHVRGNETLLDVLKPYDDDDTVGAFGVNWQIHTSGGLLTRPPSARKGFTRCIEDQDPNHPPNVGTENEHIKVLVKPSLAIGPDSPHKFKLKDGARTVGEDGDTVDRMAWRIPITRNRVALHHYATRSREEYEAKISRGNGMGDPKGWDWWNHVEAIRTDECLELAVLDP